MLNHNDHYSGNVFEENSDSTTQGLDEKNENKNFECS